MSTVGTPGADALWLLPLGGSGEIGINANLYGHDGQWLMVDCGIGFEKKGADTRVIAPQIDFIAARRDRLAALLVTHAHEDHVGAVASHWAELRCPVYCTPLTAAILRGKLADEGMEEHVPLHVVPPGSRTRHAGFEVQWLPITHSVPESQALVIRTAAGNILHTGDWKFDSDPVVGPAYSESELRGLSQEGILALVGDSTNATVPGRTPSEGALLRDLARAIRNSRGRVIVSCFGSNLARLHTLQAAGFAAGRYCGLLGRSLTRYVSAARAADLWHPPAEPVPPAHLGYLPTAEVMAIATGSQGEHNAALDRLSRGTQRDLELNAGDTVLFSARVIPGNETAVEALKLRLQALGVQTLDASDGLFHASGHPAQEDLRDMYDWVRPKVAVPVHGEDVHLEAHAELARRAGVPRVVSVRNGDLVQFAPQHAVFRQRVVTGRIELRR